MKDLYNYYAEQLAKITPNAAGTYPPQFKITQGNKHTNFISLSNESATELVKWLCEHYEIETRTTTAIKAMDSGAFKDFLGLPVLNEIGPEIVKYLDSKGLSCDTPNCKKCKGRTALIKGYWNYAPDDEPYVNGVTEKALIDAAEDYLVGYKCDKCGHLQEISQED